MATFRGFAARVRRLMHPAVPPSVTPLMTWDNDDPATNGENWLVRAFAPRWRTAFDVGANVGDYSRTLRAANSACRLTLFEPNPELAGQLRRAALGTVVETAVGDAPGRLVLHVNPAFTGMSSAHRAWEGTQPVDVALTSLDAYCAAQEIECVDFLKIDTEGNEVAVLRGANRLLKQKAIGMMQFEYGGTYTDAGARLADIYELLSENYVVCHLNPSGLLPLAYDPALETYRYSNWVAILRENMGR